MKPNFLNAAGSSAAGTVADAPEPDADDAGSSASASASSSMSNELCVPVSSLAMPDDQEQLTNPEPGDVVQLQVEAKVARIEGESAYVTPQTVNGHQLKPATPEPTPEEQDQQQYGELQDMARGVSG